MKYFSEIIKSSMEHYFGDNYQISVHRVKKNNGICKTGLNILEKGKNSTPVIYLDYYLEEYKKGRDLGEIYQTIIYEYELHKDDIAFGSSVMMDFENIKETICLKLVNLKKNQELLEEIPYIAFQDLAIIFYVTLTKVGENASITIDYHMLNSWNRKLAMDELYSLALVNTQRIFKEQVTPMEELIAEILNMRLERRPLINGREDKKEVFMYIATNMSKINGATVLLYPGLLKDFADKIEGDFYILPSSIHETIFIPADDGTRVRELAAMVKDVNETQVLPEEVLSDSVYLYSRQSDCISICSP